MVFGDILIQAGAYGVVLILAMGFTALIQRGFFWKYLKVRLSFGKLVMIKFRSKLRDHFAVGRLDSDGFLVYKQKDEETSQGKSSGEQRVKINTKEVFYRCLSVNWVDIDEEKRAICNVDYTPIDGFDAKKYNDLYVRALMRPEIGFSKEKLIVLLLIITILAGVASIYLGYMNSEAVTALQGQISNLASSQSGTVVGGAGNI